jgi:hypothetical protein
LCEEVPRQNAAESRKIPESGSVIPREGVESRVSVAVRAFSPDLVIPREGVESNSDDNYGKLFGRFCDPERGS